MGTDEGVELAEFGDEASFGIDGNVRVVQLAVAHLDKPGEEGDADVAGELFESSRASAVGNCFSQGLDFGEGKVLEEGVARDAALVEADDLGPLLGGLSGKALHAVEIVVFLGVACLELGRGDSDVAHGRGPKGRTKAKAIGQPDAQDNGIGDRFQAVAG